MEIVILIMVAFFAVCAISFAALSLSWDVKESLGPDDVPPSHRCAE